MRENVALGEFVEAAFTPAPADPDCTLGGITRRRNRFAQPDVTDGRGRGAAIEPSENGVRRHVAGDGGFAPGIERGAAWRVRRQPDHRVYLGEFGAAVAVHGIAPLQELAGDTVLALIAHGKC